VSNAASDAIHSKGNAATRLSVLEKKNIMKTLVFVRLSFLSLVSLLIFAACSKGGGGGAYGGNNNNNTGGNADPNTVKMAGMSFSPASLSVAPGTTVTFLNNDNTTHTVTDDDGAFDSGNIAPGANYKHTFMTAGTVKYHCKIHTNMKASVVVTP
jgi:plastocyanin